MSIKCRYSGCEWCGFIENIFEHFERQHPKSMRENNGTNYYDFTFEEFGDTFLLSATSGLYWFCADPIETDVKHLGIFQIGNSEPISYTVKFGLNSEGLTEYLGPHKSLCAETDPIYELEVGYDYIQYFLEELDTFRIRLYFGKYNDVEEMYAVTWEDTEVDDLWNMRCEVHFICCLCYELFGRKMRFCENVHYVCSNCFKGLQKRGKLRCPLCLTNYPYDDNDWGPDRFLNTVRFPGNEGRQEEKRRRTA